MALTLDLVSGTFCALILLLGSLTSAVLSFNAIYIISHSKRITDKIVSCFLAFSSSVGMIWAWHIFLEVFL